jgi:hypothetical protein
MAKQAQKGTVEQAMQLQETNGVLERFRYKWFHSSKDRRTELTDHPEPTFWSRSPQGWTLWGGDRAGDPIHVAYIVAPLSSPDSVNAFRSTRLP